MPDRLTRDQRSLLMSHVKPKNTSLEKTVFSRLRREKLRFKKHAKGLPGTPDVIFVDERVAVFIDGDFWHGYRFPVWERKLTRFWRNKIAENRSRDRRNFAKLRRAGWTVIRIWQHEIQADLEGIISRVIQAIK